VLKESRISKNLTEPAEYYLDFFKDFSTTCIIEKRFDRSADPDDNFLFDLAYTIKAYYLITGEKALLNMKYVNKIRIITLKELMALIEKAK
jgi:putative PIN family toxin of toxin-antitoxin system